MRVDTIIGINPDSITQTSYFHHPSNVESAHDSVFSSHGSSPPQGADAHS